MTGALDLQTVHVGTALFRGRYRRRCGRYCRHVRLVALTGRHTDTPNARRDELRAVWWLAAPFVVVAALSVFMVFNGE